MVVKHKKTENRDESRIGRIVPKRYRKTDH